MEEELTVVRGREGWLLSTGLLLRVRERAAGISVAVSEEEDGRCVLAVLPEMEKKS